MSMEGAKRFFRKLEVPHDENMTYSQMFLAVRTDLHGLVSVLNERYR